VGHGGVGESEAWLGITLLTWLVLEYYHQQGYAVTIDQAAQSVNIIKIEEIIVVEEEVVPYAVESSFNPQLRKGQLKLLQQGENGLVLKTLLIRKENGITKSRRLLETKVLKAAVPEISEIGIRDTIVQVSRELSQPRQVLEVKATAYTHTGNTTYTGVYPRVGTVAVDPAVIPLGSRLWIEGYGYGIAQDTGGFIQGNRVDLFMDTERDCLNWGRRTIKVYLLD